MNTKQWWLSKTLWGIVIAIIATGLQMTGVVSISDIEQTGLIDRLIVIADLLAQLFEFFLCHYLLPMACFAATRPYIARMNPNN